ncbi:protein of unknown function [Burkholderia multivorans]
MDGARRPRMRAGNCGANRLRRVESLQIEGNYRRDARGSRLDWIVMDCFNGGDVPFRA